MKLRWSGLKKNNLVVSIPQDFRKYGFDWSWGERVEFFYDPSDPDRLMIVRLGEEREAATVSQHQLVQRGVVTGDR